VTDSKGATDFPIFGKKKYLGRFLRHYTLCGLGRRFKISIWTTFSHFRNIAGNTR